jgi:hypothetical protein
LCLGNDALDFIVQGKEDYGSIYVFAALECLLAGRENPS